MSAPFDIVILGLSLSSSWGNGHATTYRALLKGLETLGRRVLFLERDMPWYASHRDMPQPPFCRFALYDGLDGLAPHLPAIAHADAVIVGSYVPDGVAALDLVLETARGPVAFYDIDTPVTLAALARGEDTYIAPRQIPQLDAYFSFTGGPTLTRLEREFGARRALPLYCSVDPDLYRPTQDAALYDLGYLGTYSPDRQPAVERLLIEPARLMPERRFILGGPGFPDDIDWPANIERVSHVPPADHAAFYRSQRFTLNCTRADMVAAGWSPSVRLFEAAACGVPVISDPWPGLGDFFEPGRAILVAQDASDVLDALAAPRARGEALAAEARAQVLARHTGAARAAELVANLRDLRRAAEPPTRTAAYRQGATQ
jgi:spore maturation protein CgeB